MRYPKPSSATRTDPYFEYEASKVHTLRPLQEEVWTAIRLLAVPDIGFEELRKRFPRRRERPLRKIATMLGSCVTQAEEYFRLALGANSRAAPLLHYYSVLNLTKALIYLDAPARLADKKGLRHGLSDPASTENPDEFSFGDDFVRVTDGVFRSLNFVLTGNEVSIGSSYRLRYLLQYCTWITGEFEQIYGEPCKLVHAALSVATDADAKSVRLQAEVYRFDVESHCATVSAFGAMGEPFTSLFHRVASDDSEILRYESGPISYDHGRQRVASIEKLRNTMRKVRLYRNFMHSEDSATAEYLIPLRETQNEPLPEPCVLFAITFYLGSLVRYRPHIYDRMLGSEDAWLLEAYIRQCPIAFAYIMLNHLWRTEHLFQQL